MFTVDEIVKITGGILQQGALKRRLSGVTTDTRKGQKGELFIAIKGDTFDGHDYTRQAEKNGAAAVLVCRSSIDVSTGVPVILVKDTVKALGAIARFHRLKFKIPVIAITGSAGKTSTKEFIAAVLGKKYKVLYNQGTENNHIGVPMTLLRLTKKHTTAVIEAGTNHFGEIAWLGSIICPTIVVFTNIGQSHLAGLKNPAGVYREKCTLIKHLAKNGTVIVNADDVYLRKILSLKLSQKVITYAIDRPADFKAVSVETRGKGLAIALSPSPSEKKKGMGLNGSNREIQLPVPVWGNVYNALAAAACGQLLKVSFSNIAFALKRTKPAKGRQCFYRVRGITLIDDTYNANPVSYYNALRTLSLACGRGKSFLVAADMLELGDQSESIHRDIGAAAGRVGIDHIFTIGRWAGLIGGQAKKINPLVQARHYTCQEDIQRDLQQGCTKGDILLIKGSRGMHMERVVENFLKIQ